VSGPEFIATDVTCFEAAAFRDGFDMLCRVLQIPVLAPGETAEAGVFLILAHRPGRLMLLSDAPVAPPPMPDAEAGLIDLSSAKRQIRLNQPFARDLLMRGCRMDLRDNALGANRVAQTLFGQVPVILVCDAPGRDYRLLFDRSLQATLQHGLQRAAITLV
jgi:heterotetrameric sarcosine oxidase gamma subunit